MSSGSGNEVWIVRHGETEWSASGKHTSFTDLPLTAHGEEVGRSLAGELVGPFDAVLTSPRLRARRTAQLAGYDDAEVDPDLVEWNYGDYEGLTTATIRETVPGWTVWTHPSVGGESAVEVAARCDRVIARVRQAAGPVLIFGHGHSLRALTARWLDLDVAQGCHFRLDTATISVLGYERETPVIKRWNA